MDIQQERSETSSALFSVPRALGFIPLRFRDSLLTILTERTQRIGRILPRHSALPIRETNGPKWSSEVRGWVGPKDFVVVILAHYRGWICGQDETLQLNAVKNDPQILLKALGYAHGDTSRRWYFITDFDVDYEDTNGLVKPIPRAVYPGTERLVLPTKEGILSILREASAGGGSGFVHCGVHGMFTAAGTSLITPEPAKKFRYTEIPNGSLIKEAFIATTDGKRLYGREFVESLGDGTEKRCGTTLTLSLDMCNASAFLAGIVDMPYQYRGEGIQEPVPTTRSTNQLVVISASQPGQPAGTCNDCGAMTLFLTTVLASKKYGPEGPSAAAVAQFMHKACLRQPDQSLLQTPQITSRYQLTGRFWLLPTPHSML